MLEVLAVLKEPVAGDATFMEKLTLLERLGLVPSVERGDELRELRNALTHDYPEEPAEPAATVHRAVEGARALLEIFEADLAWLHDRLPQ